MIGVGLVGYGLAGRVFHAPLIDADPRLTLAAVATSQPDAVRARYPDVKTVPTFDELLARPEIDLIVIATPNRLHYAHGAAALRAGRHVVIDKPFTVTAAEADQLLALAEARGLCLSAYQNRRWDGDFRTVQTLVRDGRLGVIQTLISHFDRYRPTVRHRWREADLPGSGLLYDLGAHLVDQAVELMGTPNWVSADAARQRPGAATDDYFHIVLGFGQRRAILHGGSFVTRPPVRFAVHGSLATYIKHGLDVQEAALRAGATPAGDPNWGTEPAEQWGDLVSADGATTSIETQPGAYQLFYHDLATALLQGTPPPVTAVAARNVVAILEAAHESARDGRRIALSGRLQAR